MVIVIIQNVMHYCNNVNAYIFYLFLSVDAQLAHLE